MNSQPSARPPAPGKVLPAKPNKTLHVLSLLLRGRFADAVEYNANEDTEN